MTMTPITPGIDPVIAFEVAKTRLAVHRWPQDVQTSIANTPDEIARLMRRWASGPGAPLLVCEATGGYERHVLDQAHEHGLPVHRAHGSRTRAFARFLGQRAKSDPIDARMLALYGASGEALRLHRRPSPEEEALRALRKRCDELGEMIRMETNRLEHASMRRITRSLQRHVAAMRTEKAVLEQEIKACVTAAPALARKAALLRSVPGIGDKTAIACLAYLPELGSLTRGEAASLVGLAPHPCDSGALRGRRRIEAGRAAARKSLYMAALVASRHNPVMAGFAERLRAKGKPHKLVLTAIRRRLIVILNAVLKSGEPCRTALTETA